MCLGDEIIRFAETGQTSSAELGALYRGTRPILTCPRTIIRINKSSFSLRPPVDGKYITYQFDKAFTQKTWCPEHIFTNRQLHAIYHHYASRSVRMIDVGHHKFLLKDAANVIYHAIQHVGLCSGMGWLAVACHKTPDIWYATNSNCSHVTRAKHLWVRNGANVQYFDQCFRSVPCNVAFDGLRYEYHNPAA